MFESLIQPFIILLTVPLGLIGVFLAFIISGTSFDSSAYIGVILLGGIVVNNSILLVDHINRKRKEGLEAIEAAIEGARERLRPIMMTTGTTVFGILPMLLIPSESGRMRIWSSLGFMHGRRACDFDPPLADRDPGPLCPWRAPPALGRFALDVLPRPVLIDVASGIR